MRLLLLTLLAAISYAQTVYSECCDTYFFKDVGASDFTGLFTKWQESGAQVYKNGYPVYKNANGNYLFYKQNSYDWTIGPDYNSNVWEVSGIESDDDKGGCPEEYYTWHLADGGSWTTVASGFNNIGECRAAVAEALTASSHGDPIIWTFKNECYDLNIDGLYLASSHPDWFHDVYIAVYNEFIREIQIRDSNDGDILLSISNLQEVSGTWEYGFKERIRQCKNPTWKECEFTFNQYDFDAQVFKYSVQIMYHDYLDPSLKAGERGMHLDIYPRVYARQHSEFKASEYEGAYFDNPQPDQLAFCPAESVRRQF